jgi:hypothetical protein
MLDPYAVKSMLVLYSGETSLCLISLCLIFFAEKSMFDLHAEQSMFDLYGGKPICLIIILRSLCLIFMLLVFDLFNEYAYV